MRIGVDIDGVINNFHEVASKYIKQDYGVDWYGTTYDIYKGLTAQQVREFLANRKEKFLTEIKSVKNSRDVIVNLLNAKHQIYLITARGYDMADDTIRWLKQHKFIYTDVYFNCGNKVDACKWKEVHLMIEDSPHNLMALAKNKIPYIIFNQSYNQEVYGELLRTDKWTEIEEFLRYYGE